MIKYEHMTEEETEQLLEELEQFRREKDKIRSLVGQIGGTKAASRDRIINLGFIVAIAVILAMDLVRHMLNIDRWWIPEMLSLEIAVFLVSIKIIWMIHLQSRVEHFQFWILNAIEFRLNDAVKRLRDIEDKIDKPSSDA